MRSVTYLVQYFFDRITAFFRHWYVGSFFVFSHHYFSALAEFDRILAWQVTLKNIFQPLYKDFSIIGYVLGFVFRLGRLAVGGFIYLCLFVIAAALFVIWFSLPVYIFSRIFNIVF